MDSYFLDKRKVKRVLKKYGFSFLFMVPILGTVSFAISGIESSVTRVLILVAVGFVLLWLIDLFLAFLQNRKDKKQQQDVVVVNTGAKTKTYVNKKVQATDTETDTDAPTNKNK